MSSVIRKRTASERVRQCACNCGAWLLPGARHYEGTSHDDGRAVAYVDLEHFIFHMRAINKGGRS